MRRDRCQAGAVPADQRRSGSRFPTMGSYRLLDTERFYDRKPRAGSLRRMIYSESSGRLSESITSSNTGPWNMVRQCLSSKGQ